VAVCGDFFLDRYFILDPRLEERSRETGLPARQVVAVENSAGHGGTVTNNLRALGVGTVYAVGWTGDDGEGYELRRALERTGVRTEFLGDPVPGLPTGTYMKPLERHPDGTVRELERLDLRTRQPLPAELEGALLERLRAILPRVQAVIVADQVDEPNLGAVTERVRAGLLELAAGHPEVLFGADSRRRIGRYRGLILKANRAEALEAVAGPGYDPAAAGREVLERCARALAERSGRAAFVTLGGEGMLAAAAGGAVAHVPGIPVTGPTDPTGAGDAATAGLAAALCAGASFLEAAALGNLVAAVTVRKLGTTGTCTPAEALAAYDAAGLPVEGTAVPGICSGS